LELRAFVILLVPLQESVEFAVFAISLAISLDSSSGGVARVTIITEDGVERKTFSGDELPCH